MAAQNHSKIMVGVEEVGDAILIRWKVGFVKKSRDARSSRRWHAQSTCDETVQV